MFFQSKLIIALFLLIWIFFKLFSIFLNYDAYGISVKFRIIWCLALETACKYLCLPRYNKNNLLQKYVNSIEHLASPVLLDQHIAIFLRISRLVNISRLYMTFVWSFQSIWCLALESLSLQVFIPAYITKIAS